VRYTCDSAALVAALRVCQPVRMYIHVHVHVHVHVYVHV